MNILLYTCYTHSSYKCKTLISIHITYDDIDDMIYKLIYNLIYSKTETLYRCVLKLGGSAKRIWMDIIWSLCFVYYLESVGFELCRVKFNIYSLCPNLNGGHP